VLAKFKKFQKNFIFSVIIIAIVAVMALVGINSQQGETKGSGGAAAWVNGEVITNQQFGQVLEQTVEEYRQRLGGQLDERLLTQFEIPQNTLDEMVRYKLLAQQATRLGFRVTDEELADFIRKAPNFHRDGKFDPELYRKIPNRGLEEKRIRESMLIRRMQMYLARRVQVPQDMLEREYGLRETKAGLSFARIDMKALAGKPTPSKAEIDATLKSTSPEALKAYYDGHQREFTSPAAVNLRQIRVGIPFQASPEKKAEAKKKIDSIAAEVNAANFEAMAKKHSDDEFAKKGGAAGWVNRGTLEKEMDDAVGKLQPGEVSKPVATGFGYYILQVKETRPESTKLLNTVKEDIARELWKEKHAQEFANKKKAEWEKKLAEGKSIEAELKAANIDVKKTGPFSVGQGYIPQIGSVDAINDALFTLTKAKPVGPKLYPNGTDFYFIKLESLETPKAGDFQANLESVATTLETSLQTTFLKKWIESLKDGAAIRIEAKFESARGGNPFSQQ
jgi:peptidyl-prolyl cis-trans isomerase D